MPKHKVIKVICKPSNATTHSVKDTKHSDTERFASVKDNIVSSTKSNSTAICDLQWVVQNADRFRDTIADQLAAIESLHASMKSLLQSLDGMIDCLDNLITD